MRVLLALLYLIAGVLHLAVPRPFLSIMPDFVPMPAVVVALTGVAEIAGAVGLMIPRLRRAAGWSLAAYALCVWPANVQHAINDLTAGTGLPILYHAPRLALQPLIIAWALWAGGIIGRR
ncbi:DoxX family protein [Sphingomonas sp. BGYR3]|uniref:DoxX family protein n=1 Tax=Sphingomonas sp. BGYR3 TaxID=2975483 RepID=UPI0021A4366D|nr:DoxX family protein [Sphingomonas sp. BGYR3]MDG5488420.1 DoxX family protein [Sphingomonas sp. BGYR3]